MKRLDALDWIFPSIKNRTFSKKSDTERYNFRIEKAKQQLKLEPVSRENIIEYVNEFLVGLGMEHVDNPRVKPKNREKRRFDYYEINPESKEDIVWIKFSKTEKGDYISVIGTSCDISFSEKAKNETSAGIINQELEIEWDEKEVLIFPLRKIPDYLYRSDIESGIGNYLISKGVPILDYYSHNF